LPPTPKDITFDEEHEGAPSFSPSNWTYQKLTGSCWEAARVYLYLSLDLLTRLGPSFSHPSQSSRATSWSGELEG